MRKKEAEGRKRAKLRVLHKVIEGLTTVLHIEATTLVPNPDEIQTLEMLDQLEEYLGDLGATPTCSIVRELKEARTGWQGRS